MDSLWALYVREHVGTARQEDVATRVGVSQGTISRWMNGTKIPTDAANVAAFALAVDRNVLEAFVAAGMLTEEQLDHGLDEDERALLRRLRIAAGPVPDDVRRPRLDVSGLPVAEDLADDFRPPRPELNPRQKRAAQRVVDRVDHHLRTTEPVDPGDADEQRIPDEPSQQHPA